MQRDLGQRKVKDSREDVGIEIKAKQKKRAKQLNLNKLHPIDMIKRTKNNITRPNKTSNKNLIPSIFQPSVSSKIETKKTQGTF